MSEADKDEVYYIRRSALQLSELIDDLLDLAKVEAGKIEVSPTIFEVRDLFGALRGMLRPLLVNDALSLVFEDTEGLPPICSDERKVSQILRNLVSNALKYTERGEVRVGGAVDRDAAAASSCRWPTPASASRRPISTRCSTSSSRSRTRCSAASRARGSACRCPSGSRSCWAAPSRSRAPSVSAPPSP